MADEKNKQPEYKQPILPGSDDPYKGVEKKVEAKKPAKKSY